MSIFNGLFKDTTDMPAQTEKKEEKRVIGKIIKLEKDEEKGGWGFISSKDVPFTRIFFHWTSLRQDTLRFQDLKNGMKVEFVAVEVPDKGYRAIKIKVMDEQASVS